MGQPVGPFFVRDDVGWEGVVELLRSSVDDPVVTSYSVCNSFPNERVAMALGTWLPEGTNDADVCKAWDALSDAKRWKIAMNALRSNERATDYGLELKLENWNSYHFGDGVCGLNLTRLLSAK